MSPPIQSLKIPASPALRAGATMAGLFALVWAAPLLSPIPAGHLAADLIGLARSRAVIYNPGVTGYYERLFGATKDPQFMTRADFVEWRKHFDDRNYDDSFLTFRFKSNLHDLKSRSEPQGLTTNSYALAGPEITLDKPPHTRRIAVFGDSLTLGWGTNEKDTYVRQLEADLNRSPSQRFEFLNFSAPGYQLDQTMDRALSEAPRFHPDVYLVSLTELAVSRNWATHLVYVVRFGLDKKYDFVRDIIRRSGATPEDDGLTVLGKLAPYRREFLRDCLEQIRARAAQDGAQMVIALIPSAEDAEMCRRRFADIRDLIASIGVPVIDALGAFDAVYDREQLRMNALDIHPNARGHMMIANTLYSAIRANTESWKAFTGFDDPRSH